MTSTPAALTSVATTRLTAAGTEEFRDLANTERSQLEAAGVDVAAISASRWANGQGAEYARITLAPARDADADALALAADGIADLGIFTSTIVSVVPVLIELAAVRAAAGIVAEVARRVATFKVDSLHKLAPALSALQDLTSVESVLVAIRGTVVAAPADETVETTALVRPYVDSSIQGAKSLAPALAEHPAAIGVVDLSAVPWLLRQKGVKSDQVRTALIAMIKTEELTEVLPTLGAVRAALKRSWAVGKALVERAAATPEGARTVWLDEAESWSVPPARGQRQARDDYSGALDAAASDPAAQPVVARLRSKL